MVSNAPSAKRAAREVAGISAASPRVEAAIDADDRIFLRFCHAIKEYPLTWKQPSIKKHALMPIQVVLGLGSNIGARQTKLEEAVSALSLLLQGMKCSSLYESAALLPDGAPESWICLI